MWEFSALFVLLVVRISAEPMQVELYRDGYKVSTGIISSTVVASRLQCVHKCKRKANCQGINVRVSDSNSAQCEISSSRVGDQNDSPHLVASQHWQFYRVIQVEKVSHLLFYIRKLRNTIYIYIYTS